MNVEKSPIKITHIVPSLNTGGVQKYILSLSKFDSSNGIRRKTISIISEGGRLTEEFSKAGIKSFFCPVILPDRNRRPFRLFKYIRKLAALTFAFRFYRLIKNDDSEIICSNDLSCILSQVFPSLFTGKKFILYIHTEKAVIKRWKLIIIFLLIKYKGFIILSVSAAAAKANLKFLYNNPNSAKNFILIVPSGRNLDLIINELDNREKNRKLFGIKNNQILIGSIGRLHWSKGFDILIKVINNLRQNYSQSIILLIAGDGPKREELNNLIHKLNLVKNIFLLGDITNVHQFLSALDIYVQPSISEGFGGSVIEAMSAGRPVVSSDTGGLGEIITNNINGMLFQSGNIDSLIDKLKQMINLSSTKKKKMVFNATQSIQSLSIEEIYKKNLKIYKELIGEID